MYDKEYHLLVFYYSNLSKFSIVVHMGVGINN